MTINKIKLFGDGYGCVDNNNDLLMILEQLETEFTLNLTSLAGTLKKTWMTLSLKIKLNRPFLLSQKKYSTLKRASHPCL